LPKGRILRLALLSGLFSALSFTSGCLPATDGESPGFDWTVILVMGVVFVAFYFILIRPQRKKQKEQEQMIGSLKKGHKVITAGGIYGVIESTSDDNVVIKVESGATLRVTKASVTARR
jgi:preprotein translocase subunit YajC